MGRSMVSNIVVAIILIAGAGQALALTCEECKENDRKKIALETEMARKDSEIKYYFDQKKFHQVTEIRKQLMDMRKDLVELQKKDLGCKDACKPDVVKQLECDALRAEIVKLEEETAADADTEKVDKLYRDLSKCHKELEQLRKTQ